MTDEHAEDFVADLAKRIISLERKLSRRGAANLRHAAIDGGKGISLKDENGREVYRVGTDPVTGVTSAEFVGGYPPHRPEPPHVDVGGEVVKIQHSGIDHEGIPAQKDFRRAEVHVAREESFEPSLATLAAYLEEANGSVTHRLPGGEWFVGVVWVTHSGLRSPMSETVLADIPPLVDAEDIADTLEEAEQIIADAVAEAQTQLDTLRDRLDNFEEYDPSDLIAQINQVTEDLADARQEAAGLVADLADQVDGIKIPDVSGFITQAEVDAAATAAETAAKEHADLVAQGAEDNAIAEAEAKADAAREAAELAAKDYADQQDVIIKGEAAADAQTKADAAQAEAERLAAEHAELVATGAKDDAIAEAERLHALAIAEAEAAQSKADEAHANAGTAWDHADAAMTRAGAAETNAKQHADALPKMLGGSTAPTGTAPNGSIWFRRDSNNTVIGRWERIGGSWVQQEVSGELIDNLEAGKITALNTEFAESVVGKLWTQLAIVDRLIATSAWIGGAMIGEDAVEAKHVVASETLSGKVAEFLKLSVADLIAGSAEIDEAVVEKFWAAFGVFDRLTAAEAWVTGDLVVGETIRTRHLHVTQEMVGEFAKFMHLVVDQMDVNALWADTAWLTAIETASVRLQSTVDSWVTNISGRGMEVISPEGQPTVQLGNFEETGLTLYQDGEATASMSDDGHVSGTIVSANDEFYYQGNELTEILALEHLPKGPIAYYVTESSLGPYYKETGIGYFELLAVPGRLYKVTVSGQARTDHTAGAIRLQLRRANTGSPGAGFPPVTVESSLEGGRIIPVATGYSYRTVNNTFYWAFQNPDLVDLKPTRLLLTIAPFSDDGSRAQLDWQTALSLEDVGLIPDTNFHYSRGGSDGGNPTEPDPPAPTPVKTKRTKTYSMSWWRTWWQDGNIPSYGVGVKEAAQGRSPYFTSAGTYRSMIGFPSMTSDLSGADIDKIEVRVRVTHTHSGSGGRVRLGTHSNSSRPSSFTGHGNNNELTNTNFGRGQEKWVTLPSSTHAGFKNGSLRGVTLFTSSTSSTYYVQARPDRFAIRVTYRK